MNFLESCQTELREAEQQLEHAIQKRKEAQAEEGLCLQKVDGLKMVIASIEAHAVGRRRVTPEDVKISIVSPAPIAKFEKNKTQWVKELVDSKGEGGISPREIRQIARSLGIPLTNTFPYVILSKLKGAQKIKEAGSRYYRVDDPGW